MLQNIDLLLFSALIIIIGGFVGWNLRNVVAYMRFKKQMKAINRVMEENRRIRESMEFLSKLKDIQSDMEKNKESFKKKED